MSNFLLIAIRCFKTVAEDQFIFSLNSSLIFLRFSSWSSSVLTSLRRSMMEAMHSLLTFLGSSFSIIAVSIFAAISVDFEKLGRAGFLRAAANEVSTG